MLKYSWILNSRASDNAVADTMARRRRLGSLPLKLAGVACLGSFLRWHIKEGGVSYAGSFFDSLPKKNGGLALEVLPLVLWTYLFLVLEISAAFYCRQLDSLCGTPSMWRTEHNWVPCTVSFSRWLVIEGWLSWLRSQPDSALGKVDALYMSAVFDSLPRKAGVPYVRSFPLPWKS